VSAAGDRRLPARFLLPVTGFILSGIMTIIISIAFPTVLVVLPIVRRIVARIVATP